MGQELKYTLSSWILALALPVAGIWGINWQISACALFFYLGLSNKILKQRQRGEHVLQQLKYDLGCPRHGVPGFKSWLHS